jgi:hypothetical protein
VSVAAGAEAACVQTGPHAKVLLVHWTQSQEEELHRAMNRGLAVVSAGCQGTRLLPECSIRGLYQYFGTVPTTQRLDLDPAGMATNLSFGGSSASAHALRARVQRR